MVKNNKKFEDDWQVVAWINSTENGKVLVVSEPAEKKGESGKLIGFVNDAGLRRVLRGEIDGIPVKTPPPEDDEDDEYKPKEKKGTRRDGKLDV